MGSNASMIGPNGAGRGQPRQRKAINMAPSRGLARALHATLENHKGPVHVARYAKGSAKYILTGGQDRVVRLWNPSLGTEIKAYSAHGYEVLSISV
jgi:mitogen-activated protein kinase organizer 1